MNGDLTIAIDAWCSFLARHYCDAIKEDVGQLIDQSRALAASQGAREDCLISFIANGADTTAQAIDNQPD